MQSRDSTVKHEYKLEYIPADTDMTQGVRGHRLPKGPFLLEPPPDPVLGRIDIFIHGNNLVKVTQDGFELHPDDAYVGSLRRHRVLRHGRSALGKQRPL
jgi:hypothetical protein